MKLKKLRAIGHNAAHSYFSTLGHIGQEYTSTVLHRLSLQNDIPRLELDVLNTKLQSIQNTAVEASLFDFRIQFFDMLRRENIPVEIVNSYKIFVERLSDRMDVVDIRCQPELKDSNGKVYNCAEVSSKYPAPMR